MTSIEGVHFFLLKPLILNGTYTYYPTTCKLSSIQTTCEFSTNIMRYLDCWLFCRVKYPEYLTVSCVWYGSLSTLLFLPFKKWALYQAVES